jgi:hypothetical protein
MIERNGSNCKYDEIFTHRVGSAGAPSRRTMFIRGTHSNKTVHNILQNIFISHPYNVGQNIQIAKNSSQ